MSQGGVRDLPVRRLSLDSAFGKQNTSLFWAILLWCLASQIKLTPVSSN